MSTVWLGLGSNIGDRESRIAAAVDALAGFLDGLRTAPLYETEARDFADQDDFLNTVVRGETTLSPMELLARTRQAESNGGRARGGIPKGPRTIDIDILLWDARIIRETSGGLDLIIPHGSMHERLFVLRPLLDLDPDAEDPRDGIPWAVKASRLESQRVMLYRI